MSAVILNDELRALLRRMWEIDERVEKGLPITNTDKEFYNKHLLTMIGYYAQNTQHWTSRRELEIVDLALQMLEGKRKNKEL